MSETTAVRVPRRFATWVSVFAALIVLAGLVGTALALRKRPDVHRRLMLASCIRLLPPAIARLPFAFVQAGGPLVVGSHPLRLIVGGTDAWMKFATWLVR